MGSCGRRSSDDPPRSAAGCRDWALTPTVSQEHAHFCRSRTRATPQPTFVTPNHGVGPGTASDVRQGFCDPRSHERQRVRGLGTASIPNMWSKWAVAPILFARGHRDSRSRSARAVQPGRPGLVRGDVRGADAGAGGGLGGDRGRAAHAHPRPDRQRQDPRRLPLDARSPRGDAAPAADEGAARHRPRPLHLAAQGADLRRRAQPPGAAGRHRPGRRAPRRAGAGHHGRQPDRRHARRGPPRTSPAGRRTSSSRRPSRSTSCSPARPARSSAASST